MLIALMNDALLSILLSTHGLSYFVIDDFFYMWNYKKF